MVQALCSGPYLLRRFSKDLKKKKLVEADYQQSGAWVMHWTQENEDACCQLVPPDLPPLRCVADDVGLRVHELEVGNSGSVIKPGDKVVVSHEPCSLWLSARRSSLHTISSLES